MLTEKRNPNSINLHKKTTLEIIELLNNEDKSVAFSVENVLPKIAEAVNLMTNAIENGGSVLYIGAGTSGRLGVLDASECPPTFGVNKNLIKGIIAGGDYALRNAIEGAEDNENQGAIDVRHNTNENDLVIGVASSGRTPYVIGGLRKAQSLGLKTVAISCNISSDISKHANISIEVPVGPEVITGSTRLKAGTAQKMVLNMLSTATMIKLGKVYDNLMVNLRATNEKLKNRSIQIIQEITGCTKDEAINANKESDGNTRIAILMIITNSNYKKAKELLEKHNDNFIKAIESLNRRGD